jgi:hypothetical protein
MILYFWRVWSVDSCFLWEFTLFIYELRLLLTKMIMWYWQIYGNQKGLKHIIHQYTGDSEEHLNICGPRLSSYQHDSLYYFGKYCSHWIYHMLLEIFWNLLNFSGLLIKLILKLRGKVCLDFLHTAWSVMKY